MQTFSSSAASATFQGLHGHVSLARRQHSTEYFRRLRRSVRPHCSEGRSQSLSPSPGSCERWQSRLRGSSALFSVPIYTAPREAKALSRHEGLHGPGLQTASDLWAKAGGERFLLNRKMLYTLCVLIVTMNSEDHSPGTHQVGGHAHP